MTDAAPGPRVRGARLTIASWNVNSIRARLRHLSLFVRRADPDVLCLQETKVEDTLFPAARLERLGFGHRLVRGDRGYSGVAILSRVPLEPLEPRPWCGRDEARHLAARLAFTGGEIELHNFYVPAGGDVPDPEANPKFAHKLAFLDEMAAWSAGLVPGVSRVLVGDLNVAPLEADVWNHERLLRVVTHTPAETERLGRVMRAHGWIDAVRRFTPPPRPLYSWWSYRARDWAKADRGRRLDHVWVSQPLASGLAGAEIVKAARGWRRPSDHAPVVVTLRA